MASDASLYPLGARLRSQGHQVFYAGIWMNADCPAKTLERLRKRIHEVSLQTGRKVAIIGHSLGGIYARELARMEPTLVEQVFLLGSPVKHALGNTTPLLRPLVAAMRFMHRGCMEGVTEACATCGLDLPQGAPDVPETCIYTKTDGIVEWHSCIDEGPLVECIEVDSSHCGIPLNLKTWDAISSAAVGGGAGSSSGARDGNRAPRACATAADAAPHAGFGPEAGGPQRHRRLAATSIHSHSAGRMGGTKFLHPNFSRARYAIRTTYRGYARGRARRGPRLQ